VGWRASDTGESAFDNVEIPIGNLIDEKRKRISYYATFALERLIMAISNSCEELSMQLVYVDYMSQREAFGKTIDKFRH
jgi:alkylation response protein AidB-like acyl-CoA dehydrogenase